MFRACRLDRIQRKVLAFAILATLLPAVTMGWQSYVVNRQSIAEKITEELANATTHAAREFNLWLKERVYEMRVFSSSYEVTENLEQILGSPSAKARSAEAQRRLTEYLRSVKGKFPDYEELTVVGPAGRLLLPGAPDASAPPLPADWQKRVAADGVVVGETYWDKARQRRVIVMAVPIKAANGYLLGMLTGMLNFGTVETLLQGLTVGNTGQVHLIARDGTVIATSQAAAARARLPAKATEALREREDVVRQYTDVQGAVVMGTLKRVGQSEWAVVAQIGRQEAYARVDRIWKHTILMVAGLVVVIGVTAYVLGLTIVRPLRRLTAAATKVAAGDLEVDVPLRSHGEVGYLTEVFNHMLARLREGRDALETKNQELQTLSITDALTGLFNRKHLIEMLTTEIARAGRLRHTFAVMMVDLDGFKLYNDHHGHLAGDMLLATAASIFKECIRSIDYAARYGGDEFLLLLHEIDPDTAVQVAERIRARMAAERFGEEKARVTVSVGVAMFPEHGGTPEAIIAAADAALYGAKDRGRDRVLLAGAARRR